MKIKVLGMIVVLLLLALESTAQAQSALSYGNSVVSSVSATSPLAFYTFNGTEGDRVTVIAIGITPGVDPAISVMSTNQQQIGYNDNDPTSPGSGDARVTVTLTQTGVHTILASSVNGTTGDMLIRLFGQPAAQTTDVSETGTTATINGETQVFSFEADPDGPLAVTVSTSTPDFSFLVSTFDPDGQSIAVSNGSDLVAVTLSVPPGTGIYTVEVSPVGPNDQGEVQVSVGEVGAPPPTEEPVDEAPEPVTTEEPVTPDTCTVSASGGGQTNVRTGPSTDYDVIASLGSNDNFVVTGIYDGWYRVEVPNIGTGWVFANVVTTSGDCSNVPTVPESEIPDLNTGALPTVAPQVTATSTPTLEPGQPTPTSAPPVQSTATFTPSYTPTLAPVQPTATFTPSYTPTTPPPAQVAPEDPRFNNPLVIPLDNTVSALDFVSYPNGDREDRIRWDITGMNPNSALSGGRARLVISVSCFGQNIDQIQIFTGGQTYSCGQTIVDREVTSDSRTGQVTITAVGGEGTYVQWVLTGTATRIN